MNVLYILFTFHEYMKLDSSQYYDSKIVYGIIKILL